jgi:hypothetical protein
VRSGLRYVAAVVVYIVITLFTKRLLTWNLAMLYFVVTIDLLPRLARRVRSWAGLARSELGADV